MDGPQDRLQPNTCGHSSETGRFPSNPRPSIATDALSRFAMWMAATLGLTWWPMVMPGPSSDTVATMSPKSAKRQQSGPAYTVTLASLRGGGVPSSDKSGLLNEPLLDSGSGVAGRADRL